MRIAASKRFALSVLMLFLFLTGGCIQMEHDLRINSDGGATYRLDYAISEQAIHQFRAMFKLKNQLAAAAGEPTPGSGLEPLLEAFLDPNEAKIRQELSAFADDGVLIQSIRQESRIAWRHIQLRLEISNLALLAENPFFNKHGFSLSRNPGGHYTWSRASHLNEPNVRAPSSTYELKQISLLLEGFKTVVKVSPPGRILSTTAAQTSLQTASWEFDFNRQPEAVQTLLRQHFHIVFDAPQAQLPELRQQP